MNDWIPVASAAVGGVIGWGGAYLSGWNQRRLQRYANERDDIANRAIILALLKDLGRYVSAAALWGAYDATKWGSPLNRLLHRAMMTDTAKAVTPEQLLSIMHAAFSTELTLSVLSPIKQPTDPGSINDSFQNATQFIARVRPIAATAYIPLSRALAALGDASMPEHPELPEVDEAIQHVFHVAVPKKKA